MKEIPYFNPTLPPDLNKLKVNLLWRGTQQKVDYVGYRLADANGVAQEKILDINGTTDEAQNVIDETIIPELRDLFADELEEGKEDVTQPKESVRSDVADETPAQDAGRRRGTRKAK